MSFFREPSYIPPAPQATPVSSRSEQQQQQPTSNATMGKSNSFGGGGGFRRLSGASSSDFADSFNSKLGSWNFGGGGEYSSSHPNNNSIPSGMQTPVPHSLHPSASGGGGGGGCFHHAEATPCPTTNDIIAAPKKKSSSRKKKSDKKSGGLFDSMDDTDDYSSASEVEAVDLIMESATDDDGELPFVPEGETPAPSKTQKEESYDNANTEEKQFHLVIDMSKLAVGTPVKKELFPENDPELLHTSKLLNRPGAGQKRGNISCPLDVEFGKENRGEKPPPKFLSGVTVGGTSSLSSSAFVKKDPNFVFPKAQKKNPPKSFAEYVAPGGSSGASTSLAPNPSASAGATTNALHRIQGESPVQKRKRRGF